MAPLEHSFILKMYLFIQICYNGEITDFLHLLLVIDDESQNSITMRTRFRKGAIIQKSTAKGAKIHNFYAWLEI